MTSSSQFEKENKDRTSDAFKAVEHLKATKWKGEIILLLDGSGRVAKVKKSEFI